MRIGDLRPLWHRGSGWWDGRSAREQMLLGALAGVALLALLLILVVRPLEQVRARAASDIRTYDGLAMRLRAAGPRLGSPGRSGPASAIVSQSAAAAGISVQRIEPQGARLNVVLADARFDQVLRFVADLEGNSALRISEARIERSLAAGGQVSAQFLVAGG